MREVNVYLNDLSPTSLTIAKKVRAWGTRKVRLWVSAENLEDSDFKRMIVQWRDGKVVDQNVQIDNSVGYYEWDLKTAGVNPIASDGLKAILQRCRTQNLQFVIVGDEEKCKHQFAGFIDAQHCPDLPDVWQVCKWVSTYDELYDLCRQQGVFDFDLANLSRFSPTGKEVQGARVYEERSTKRLIYLDHLHRTHYEVFDSQGHHLGEMNLNGDLDRSTAGANKRLDVR